MFNSEIYRKSSLRHVASKLWRSGSSGSNREQNPEIQNPTFRKGSREEEEQRQNQRLFAFSKRQKLKFEFTMAHCYQVEFQK